MAEVNSVNPRLFTLSFTQELISITNYIRKIEIDPSRYNDKIPDKTLINNAGMKTATLMKVTDKSFPKFYFQVTLNIDSSNSPTLFCAYYPALPDRDFKHRVQFKTEAELEKHYKNWKQLNLTYDIAEQILNGEIEDKYYTEFYEEMKSDDPKFDSEPLPPQVQELFYVRLLALSSVIEEISEVDEDEKKNVLIAIQETIDNLGRFSKKQFVQGLAKIRAKMQKWGPKILKQIGDSVIKELVKKGVEQGMKALGDIFHNF